MNKQKLEQIRARAEAARRMGLGFQGFRYGKRAFQNLVYQDIPALLTHIDELKHDNDVMYQELRKAKKTACDDASPVLWRSRKRR